MNNFRKRPAQRTTVSVDGFVGSRRPAGGVRARTATGQTRRSRLDAFDRREGFHAGSANTVRAGVAPQSAAADVSQVTRRQRRKHQRTQQSHRTRTRRLILKFSGVLLFVGLLGGGVIAGRAYFAVGDVFQGGGNAPALVQNVDPIQLNGEGDGRVNILLLGRGGEGHDGADLTDTLLVASIDPVNKQASLLSVPRDLWVKNPSGGYSKVNAVFANAKSAALRQNGSSTADQKQAAEKAGLRVAEETIESTIGIPIHYYTMVDFQGFVQAIDTVGGVDITVPANTSSGIVRETLWDELTGRNYTLDVKAGVNHFDGQRALMYSRSRHTSTRGDFDRAERQRSIIIALKDKILNAGTYSNPIKVNQLISTFGSHMQSNLGTSELARLHDLSKVIDSTKINSVGLADPPNNYVTTDFVNGQSIVRPRAGLTDYSQIQNYVRNALKDGYIQNESASVAVYNGSRIAGLAAKKATELTSFGYTITTVANAPQQTYQQTVVVDMTAGKKKYTKHYLEQRFGVTAVSTMPDTTITPGNADFVVLLGQNESTR